MEVQTGNADVSLAIFLSSWNKRTATAIRPYVSIGSDAAKKSGDIADFTLHAYVLSEVGICLPHGC